MVEKFISWAESLTVEKIGLCILVMLIAAFSLGFCIGKATEISIYSMEVQENERN